MTRSSNKPFEKLQNEIAKEKFSAIHRILDNLSGCLEALETMNGRINEAMEKNLPCRDINKMIETFNRIRADAEEWRYYFIVTREASGYFQNSLMAEVYGIPPRKELIPSRRQS